MISSSSMTTTRPFFASLTVFPPYGAAGRPVTLAVHPCASASTLLPDKHAHARQELRDVQGLREVVVRRHHARLRGPAEASGRIGRDRRDHDDGDGRRGLVAAEL